MTQMSSDDGDARSYAIIGAAMEVHSVLGAGFLESVYQQALAIEFSARGIPFMREITLPIDYKGQSLPTAFRADFLCFNVIIVELKAQAHEPKADLPQMLNYLKASRSELGLLINFGLPRLVYRRVVLSASSSRLSAASAPSAANPLPERDVV